MDVVNCADFVGLSLEDAKRKATLRKIITRVVSLDDDQYIVTDDFNRNRLNFSVKNGKIIDCRKY